MMTEILCCVQQIYLGKYMKLHKTFFQKYETEEIMITNFALQLEFKAGTVAQVGLDCMRISTGPKHVNP
jgi:hypothetical protein